MSHAEGGIVSGVMKEQGRASLGRFKPYPSYRDSGVEWLGEIPAHWEVKRLKHLLKLQKGAIKTGPFGSQLQSAEMLAGDIKVYNQRSVLDRDFVRGENYISLQKFDELRSFETLPGDLLITTRGSIGRCAVLPPDAERGILHPCLMRIQADQRRISTRFLETLIQDCGIVLDQLRLMSNATTIDVIYSESLREVSIVVPPLKDQDVIVAFLGRETTRIDALVAKKERLIELLQEKRTALITQAVTKGLPSTGSGQAIPMVPMKDSGVEWLGEIPAHWEVWRLKHVSGGLTVGVVVNPSQYVSASGVPFLRGVDVTEGHIVLDRVQYMSEDANQFHHKSILRAGDLISIRVGYPGVTAVVPTALDGSNCASLLITRRSPRIESQLLCYLMNSAMGKAQFRRLQDGAAQEQVNVSDAVDFLVPLPPKDEQMSIVQSLSFATAKIDALLAQVRDAIDRLKELRTALISAAVTGKIDVRELCHSGASRNPGPEPA